MPLEQRQQPRQRRRCSIFANRKDGRLELVDRKFVIDVERNRNRNLRAVRPCGRQQAPARAHGGYSLPDLCRG